MAQEDVRGLWRARLRWRLKGATLWPAFAAAVVVDTVVMCVLPLAGDTRPSVVGALLLAGFLNLLVVAVGAPLAGLWLRRRSRALPRLIADDRAGTALLAVVALLLVAGGLAHRPALSRADGEFAAQADAVRQWVAHRAPAVYAANVERADTLPQGKGLYRTCVPGPSADRALCLLVFTDQSPPAVELDHDQRPNALVSGPLNPPRPIG